MKFRITTSDPDDLNKLRNLLLDAPEELAGRGASVLDARLACDGNPILMQDDEHHPVVVSFDLENGETALIYGLRAVELLGHTLPWLNQVYPDLKGKQQPAKLIVVSQEPLPGSAAILSACPGLRLYVFKLLNINNKNGLWLDCASADAPAADGPAAPSTNCEDGLPALSKEEAAYFSQL